MKSLKLKVLSLILILGFVVSAAMPSHAIWYSIEQLIMQMRSPVATAVATTGLLVVGSDGTNARAFKTDSNGELQVDVLTMPAIDVLSLPAITGAVTANAGTNLNTSLLALETGGNLDTIATNTGTIAGFTCNTGAIAGTVTANAGTNLNTSLLALETGGNLATIAGKDFATQTTLSAMNAKFTAGTDIGRVGIVVADLAKIVDPYSQYTFVATGSIASGAEMLPALTGGKKYRIHRIIQSNSTSSTTTLSDSAGVFLCNYFIDLQLGTSGSFTQATADTNITATSSGGQPSYFWIWYEQI